MRLKVGELVSQETLLQVVLVEHLPISVRWRNRGVNVMNLPNKETRIVAYLLSLELKDILIRAMDGETRDYTNRNR